MSPDRRGAWRNINADTYVVLSASAEPRSVEQSISDFVAKQTGGSFEERLGMTPTLALQHVPGIHLHSDRGYDVSGSGDVRTVRLFTAIALLVLILACVNVVNLATARSIHRARDVGVQKAVGATQGGSPLEFP